MTRQVRSTSFFATIVARQSLMALVLIVAMTMASHSSHGNAQSADGDLDTTFGDGGRVITEFSEFSGISSIALEPEGKIVVAGDAGNSGNNHDFAVARYKTDGTLDPSFGSGGKVSTDFFNGLDSAGALALQPDGKIVVAGSAYNGGTNFGLARYNGDGSLDASFGSGGKVITKFGGVDYAGALALQPDGKIIAAGSAARPGQASSFGLVRYNRSGGLDTTFGNRGKTTTVFSNGFDEVHAIAIQPDGKIVAAGLADFNNSNSPIAVARYNSDGSLDSSFGSGGKVTTNFPARRARAHAVLPQTDGKIVVAGYAEGNNAVSFFALERYNVDGTLDTSFGVGGKATADFFGRGGEAHAAVLQHDGKIILAGQAGFGRASHQLVDFGLARFNTDGTLDDSFGNSGMMITDLGDVVDRANAVVLQPDGKIIAAGVTTDERTRAKFALARYNNTATFEFCIQDDSNGDLLQFNSTNGDYRFISCSSAFTLTGRGTIKVKECKTTLKHFAPDRNVSVVIKTCKNKASASIEALSAGSSFSIFDSNPGDNTCSCR